MLLQTLTRSTVLLSKSAGSGGSFLPRVAAAKATMMTPVSRMGTASSRLVPLSDARYLSSLVPSTFSKVTSTRPASVLQPSYQLCYFPRHSNAGTTHSMIFPNAASPFHCNLGSLAYFSSNSGGGNRPPQPPRIPQSSSRMGALGALGTGAVVLFGKTKYIIGALKLTKLARCVV